MKIGVEYLSSGSKRRIDILGALGLSAFISPLAVASLVSASVDNGLKDTFYRQNRVNDQGASFEITKLRTLVTGSDKSLTVYGTYDPRATRVGIVLRKFGLDEMPQLANVINGSMSLVGVRANSVNGLNHLQMTIPSLFDTWYEEAYCAAKPALIGVGQLYKRSYKDWTPSIIEEGMLRDLDYISQATFTGDIKFLGALPMNLLESSIRAQSSPNMIASHAK